MFSGSHLTTTSLCLLPIAAVACAQEASSTSKVALTPAESSNPSETIKNSQPIEITESSKSGTPALFTKTAALAEVDHGHLEWGDYDGDGDPDLLAVGAPENDCAYPTIYLYRNINGQFLRVQDPSLPVRANNAHFGDCDGDGDLDLIAVDVRSRAVPPGERLPYYFYSHELYRNDAGVFTKVQTIGASSRNLACSSGTENDVHFVDIDVDGDLDLFLEDRGRPNYFRNDAGVYVESSLPIPRHIRSHAQWADYDQDGDQDLLWAQVDTGVAVAQTFLYRNDAGTLVNTGAALPGLSYFMRSDFADVDGDGDLDLILAGRNAGREDVLSLYINAGADVFVQRNLGVSTQFSLADPSFADFDNDGDADLLIVGASYSAANTQVRYSPTLLRNDGRGIFVDSEATFLGDSQGYSSGESSSWADYDGDGFLDVTIIGSAAPYPIWPEPIAVFRNDSN